ncbi:MAG TPA: protein kinase [Pyrinomonadaceae bacterium]|jgi:serine/threonine-protein kinase|nr:protein kinase [Pyrinomonadaceae bacterium]
MPTNDWRRVEELFHAALELGGAERDDYLARECGADEALRREVESLVGSFESERSFIERPALSLGMRVLTESLAESLVGRAVGHYKVERLLGRGGMGEVYLAEDCVLERPVALKFISDHFVGDGLAREQLTKEARAVARLEHPNICAVYGVEEADGHNFIVMQYVEGETLSSLLRCGPLGVERALDLAAQVAAALSAAHDRGVVHGDVKPQNIIVTAEGQVKVLDFGLARIVRQQQDAADAGDETPQAGPVIGTVAYMSPEQARGEELDSRSDIFSLGVVLCEMLCGQNPFLRPTDEETIAAVKADGRPTLDGLPEVRPAGLGRIVRRCLAKGQGLRYGTTDRLLRDLRSARRRVRLRRYAAVALALVCVFLAATGLLYLKLSRVHTLAVLPIANKSGDANADYLSEGLTRDLFDKFSYLPRLRIKMPTVVPPDKTERAGLAEVGRKLKADAVLAGEIFRQDGALRLHLGLLDAADASQLWEGTFNLDSVNIFALQDDITREVTSGLGLWLVGDERVLLTKRQTESEEAMRLYMEGQLYYLKRDRENIKKAIAHFERARELDASFAKAYSGLADSYMLAANVAYGPLPPKEAMERAGWNARQALEIGPRLPEAHVSMGLFKMAYYSNWREAEQEFSRAIELDPYYAPAHYWYSNLLAVSGRFDESVREGEVARSLDPYSPLADVNYGRALYYARRFGEAEAHFRRLLEKNSDNKQFLRMRAFVLLQQQRYDEAIAALENVHAKDQLHAAAALGYAYGKAGRYEDARAMLRELDQLSTPQNPVPPFEKALVYVGMGDRDAAFEMLERAYQEQFGLLLMYFTTDPIYDDLRPDPRFTNLARRLNLMP